MQCYVTSKPVPSKCVQILVKNNAKNNAQIWASRLTSQPAVTALLEFVQSRRKKDLEDEEMLQCRFVILEIVSSAPNR